MIEFFKDLWKRFYITFIYDNRYLYFVEGLKSTLILTIFSFLFGTITGVILCAMRRSNVKVLQKAARIIISILVEMPTMVLLMIMVYIVFGRSALPVLWIVVVGLTLKAGAYLSEIFNTALDTVEHGEIEAARTLGMSAVQAFRYVMLPQTVERAMPLYMNQFIVALQETSVVGYLAIVDLTRASSIVSSRTMDSFFSIIAVTIIYFLIGDLFKALFRTLGVKQKVTEADA